MRALSLLLRSLSRHREANPVDFRRFESDRRANQFMAGERRFLNTHLRMIFRTGHHVHQLMSDNASESASHQIILTLEITARHGITCRADDTGTIDVA